MTLKQKSTLFYEYIGALALAALSAILYVFVYFNFYDFSKGLWESGIASFFKIATYLPLFVALFFAFVLANALKKRDADERAALYTKDTLFSRVASGAVALSLLLTLVAQLLSIGTDSKLSALLDSTSSSYMALTAALHTFTLLTAFFAAGYFAFRLQGRVAAGLGIAVICYFIF